MFANTGPGTNRNPRFPVVTSCSMISVPVMSDGIRSGVNWMREKRRSSASATVWTIQLDRKSTRLNSSHSQISYAVFCLKKKKRKILTQNQEQSTQRMHKQALGDRK